MRLLVAHVQMEQCLPWAPRTNLIVADVQQERIATTARVPIAWLGILPSQRAKVVVLVKLVNPME
jgi:hypothetical protein